MSARTDILARIRARRSGDTQKPPRYHPPQLSGDLVALFAERATTVHADVRFVECEANIAGAVADLLRARNLPAVIHVPPDAPFIAPDSALTVSREAPGPDDAALANARFGIAETGTLVYQASPTSPASWHFRAGFEIAVLHARDILPYTEDVLVRLKQSGPLPHTVNLVSGPSRTGDIEQTLELGAHGPKALAILIVKD